MSLKSILKSKFFILCITIIYIYQSITHLSHYSSLFWTVEAPSLIQCMVLLGSRVAHSHSSLSLVYLLDARLIGYEFYESLSYSFYVTSLGDSLDRYCIRPNEIMESCRIIYAIPPFLIPLRSIRLSLIPNSHFIPLILVGSLTVVVLQGYYGAERYEA